MKTFSKLLVGVDLSENCVPALKKALQMVKDTDSELTCLYVVPKATEVVDSFRQFYKTADSEQKLIQNHALPHLKEWLSEKLDMYSGDLVEIMELQVRVGDPAEEILRYADEEEFDLIVTGTHGRTGLERIWIGSVAERVVRHAPCPVLTVRRERQDVRIYEE